MSIFNKALNLSSIDDTYNSRDEKISKEGESIEKSKILGLIRNIEEYHQMSV